MSIRIVCRDVDWGYWWWNVCIAIPLLRRWSIHGRVRLMVTCSLHEILMPHSHDLVYGTLPVWYAGEVVANGIIVENDKVMLRVVGRESKMSDQTRSGIAQYLLQLRVCAMKVPC